MMMSTELLEILPRELKITFEVKRESSCSIQLGNKSDQYVAFKVKTTHPRKSIVCGLTRVLLNQSQLVISQLLCNQKFLVQSTVVPPGTTEEDITSNIFSKEGGKYIEEKKLKVVLISPPHSSFLLPSEGELKKDPCYDTSLLRDLGKDEIENIHPPHELAEDAPVFETAMDANELGGAKDADGSIPADMGELKSSKDTAEPELTKDYEELKSKLHAMDLKLREADHTI